MVRIALLLIVIISLPAGAHGFASGARLQGETDVDANRAVIVVGPGANATLHIQAEQATYDEWTESWTYTEDPTGQAHVPYSSPPINQRSGAGAMQAVGHASDWASITVTGDMAASILGASRLARDPPSTQEGAPPWAGAPAWVTSQSNTWGDWLGVRVDGSQIRLNFTAFGNATVELVGWEWACAQNCPPNTEVATTDHPSGSVTLANFTRLHGVSLEFLANAASFIVGGQSMDLGHSGHARFPVATVEGVEGFPDATRQTIETNGTISLFGVHWRNETGRIHFEGIQAQGTLRIDEDEPLVIGRDVVDVAVVVAGGSAIGFLAWFLVSKQLLAKPLEHPERQRIHQAVQTSSGLSFREIQRALGLGNGQLHYHLYVLTKSGQLRARDSGIQKIFLAPGDQDIKPEWALILRKAGMQELHDALQSLDGLPRREILSALVQDLAVARSTIRHRLGRLEEAGLIDFKGSQLILKWIDWRH